MKTDDSSVMSLRGLSETEAQARLAAEGLNELPQPDRRTPLRIALEVLGEPMFSLLLGGGAIYLLLGDIKEALILLAFALVSIVITVVQETRTEHVLKALRNLASPRALVIRDGIRKRIAGRDVARGDVIVLTEGDRVPADALLLKAGDLQADESLLTGESVPVRKLASPDPKQTMATLGLILVNRSFSSSLKLAVVRPNATLLSILLGVIAMLGLCLNVPQLRELFRFGTLHFDDLTLTIGSALLLLVALELLKPLWRVRRQADF
jgi:Ca2+-transporting ATPase